MNLKIDDSPTVTFSFARRALSSANVISGCSATNCLTSSSCAARAYPLYPPNLAGLMLPVSRCNLRKRTTELILTPSCSEVSGMVAPSCPAPTTRARRSSEYGFAIHAALHSSTNVESDSFLQGNPPRVSHFGKCSSVLPFGVPHIDFDVFLDCSK